MLAGHLGIALAAGRAERRVNVGIFITAALLLDLVLWLFILVGWESVSIPADFALTRRPQFTFPYSHGLFTALAWSAAAGVLGFVVFKRLGPARWRAAALLIGVTFSHWLLDALVHQPELPLAGASSRLVGLGLWERLPLALGVEGLIVVAGLLLYLTSCSLSRGKWITLVAISLLTLLFTVLGMTLAPVPPSEFAMAASSLATLAVICASTYWLGCAPTAVVD